MKMFGNKNHKDDTSQDLNTLNENTQSHWSIISGYLSSAVSAGQDDYGAPVVNFKIIIPLKHPTSIHYEYYALANGRRVPEIQTEMIDHWDFTCTEYNSQPAREVNRLHGAKGTKVEVTGHHSDGTFKLKKNGLSMKPVHNENSNTSQDSKHDRENK